MARSKLMLALALGSAALVAMPAVAQKAEKKAEAPKLKYSKGFTAAAQPVAKAIESGDAATIKSALQAARAAAENDDDRYAVGTMYIQGGSKLSDMALQKEGLTLALASPSIPADQRAQFSYFLGAMEYNDGNNAAALQHLNAAYQAGHRGNDIEALLSSAAQKSGDARAASEWLQRGVEARRAAGQPIDESWLKRLAGASYAAKDYPATLENMGKLLDAYPTATNWRDTLTIYRESRKLDNGDNLDLLRLVRDAKALQGQADYGEYIEMADARRMPGEVLALLREGEAAGQLGNSSWIGEQRTVANQRIAADKASLPASERDARASADGKLALVTADAFLGHGDYAKAAELYALAAQKGGVDADRAHLRRGIALTRAGDKPGATAAFGQVQAGSKKDIAGYWLKFLERGSRPAAAAPAAG